MSNDYPKRRRWDGDRDPLAYEVGDDVEDGERATVLWVDHDGDPVTETVEIGTFESHNSWLSMFLGDDMLFARPDGVLLHDPYLRDELDEIGEVKRVARADSDTSLENDDE